MAILAFDVGGTSVKYGLWHTDTLQNQGSFPLPLTWEDMQDQLLQVFQTQGADKIVGVTFSLPGVVNNQTGVIEGISAIPYIHHFDIKGQFQELFQRPVTIENDANCAALSEVWLGKGKNLNNILYFVFGTGVGGSVILNRQVHHGANLFGGEFGYMLVNESGTLSELGSIVQAAKRYSQQTNRQVDGKELYALAESGDQLAAFYITQTYRYAARGIFNLQVSFDPEKIVIGGAISKNPQFIEGVTKEVQQLIFRTGATEMNYQIEACEFGNDANLLGAIYHFLSQVERED